MGIYWEIVGVMKSIILEENVHKRKKLISNRFYVFGQDRKTEREGVATDIFTYGIST